MITIYHGVRPAFPAAACRLRLDDGEQAGKAWDWCANPFLIAGKDSDGETVCCLAHGRHHGLYRRALAGIAELFGIAVRWVDTDALLWRELDQNFSRFLTLLLFSYFPALAPQGVRRSVDRWIGMHLLGEQEERR